MFSEFTLSLVLIATTYPSAWWVAALLARRVPAISQELRVDGQRRQLSLDGLRGVLALGVVCHHAVLTKNFLQTGYWGPAATNFTNELGETSVALFFMITSFLFWGRLLEAGPKMRWDRFYLSRLFRLTPLYLVAIVALTSIIFLRSGGQLLESKRMLAIHLADWLAFTVRAGPDINLEPNTWLMVAGVTWSLRYEWAFYLALPLLGVVFAGTRQWLVSLFSMGSLLLFVRLTRFDPLSFILLRAFLGGIVTAYWIRSRKLQAIGAHPLFGALALGCIAYVMAANASGYSLSSLVLLTVFFIAAACDNQIFGFLRGAAARWLGEVSYGIYLLHGILLWVATRHFLPLVCDVRQLDDLSLCVFALLLVPPLIVGTSALNLWVERPGIALGRKIMDWGKLARPSRSPASTVPEEARAG